jgi:anti-sigma B factor antagonist
MPLGSIAEVIANLGAPIGIAAVLLWHIIWSHRALTKHNQQLLDRLADLSRRVDSVDRIGADLSRLAGQLTDEWHLKEQLAQLQRALDSEREQSRRLLQQFVDSQLNREPERISPAEESVALEVARSSSRMRIRIRGEVALVELIDRNILDEVNIQLLGDELAELVDALPDPRLAVSFKGVEHMSSAAFGTLITLNNRLRQRNGRIALFEIHPEILEVFFINKLIHLFAVFEKQADAVAFLTDDPAYSDDRRLGKRQPVS